MNRIIFILFMIFMLFSCNNREGKIYELVSTFNTENKDKSNEYLVQTKAFILDKKNVSFDFILKVKEDTLSPSAKINVKDLVTYVGDKYQLTKELA